MSHALVSGVVTLTLLAAAGAALAADRKYTPPPPSPPPVRQQFNSAASKPSSTAPAKPNFNQKFVQQPNGATAPAPGKLPPVNMRDPKSALADIFKNQADRKPTTTVPAQRGGTTGNTHPRSKPSGQSANRGNMPGGAVVRSP